MIDKNSKVLIQGITGNQGRFHAKLMKDYGTDIVAGVTPGRAGEFVEGIPVYGSVKDVLEEHDADWSVIFVPAKNAKDAAFEALNSNLNIVIITENIPVHDSLEIYHLAKEKGLVMIGPNCPGIIHPGYCKIGIMPSHIFMKGSTAIVSRSGTLTYEIVNQLTKNNIGQSYVIGIGGDPINGFNFIDALKFLENNHQTRSIILIGEIGGNMEEKTADFIKDNITKPVIAYVAGKTAPKGKRMGHAGAIIEGSLGTASSKIQAFQKANIPVADLPSDIVKLILSTLL